MDTSNILALTGLLHLALLFAHGAHIATSHGISWGIGRRTEAPILSDLDRRFDRVVTNNVESMIAFIPALIATEFISADEWTVEIAGVTYLCARVVFSGLYLANVPVLRTIAWFTGQLAILALITVLICTSNQ